MVQVVCNKAKEYGCNYNVCYHSEPHDFDSLYCDGECPEHDIEVKCIKV